MRIVLLTDRFAPSIGGVEKQCGILAREFAEHGCTITIVTDRYLLSLPRVDLQNGISIYRIWSLSFSRRLFEKQVAFFKARFLRTKGNIARGGFRLENRWHMIFLRTIYRSLMYKLPVLSFAVSSFFALVRHRKEYDVIQVFQTNWLAFSAVVAGRLLAKPVVAREGSINGIDLLDDFPFQHYTKRILISHSFFVALSRAIVENLLARGIPRERIAAIPNAVFQPPQHQPTAQDKLSVLFIGNVLNDPLQKGLDILLRAWRGVTKKITDSRLTVVGVGDFAAFKAIAGELGILHSINFAGMRTDVSPLFCSHKIFVLPSRYEGMSNTLLEAMSFGKACLVTAISGSDDLIDNGVNGLKVEPENVEALEAALLYLLEHEAEARALGDAAQEYVRRHHSPEKITRQYIDLYSTILANSSVR